MVKAFKWYASLEDIFILISEVGGFKRNDSSVSDSVLVTSRLPSNAIFKIIEVEKSVLSHFLLANTLALQSGYIGIYVKVAHNVLVYMTDLIYKVLSQFIF